MSAQRSGKSRGGRGRRIALFGGTFDPIHLGHLAVASAAVRRFRLDTVFFIPCARPPHKKPSEMLPFAHRLAMVALACSGHPRFAPSMAEADGNGRGRPFYSVDTVRRFQREYRAPGDRIFFLLGADAFLHIREWRYYETLLGLCDFIVAHRPGFPSESLRRALPAKLVAPHPAGKARAARSIALRQTTVWLLDTVESDVSATAVRGRLDQGRSIHGLVPPRVEEYINKQSLYDR